MIVNPSTTADTHALLWTV